MEKYCPNCGRVLGKVDYMFCPYCQSQLHQREGRKPIPGHLRHKVFQRDGYRCVECGATNKETTLEIDHIIPVSKGGTNDMSNLQTLCKACNRAKSATIWDNKPVGLNIDQLRLVSKLCNEDILLWLYLFDRFDVNNERVVDRFRYIVENFSEETIVSEIYKFKSEHKDIKLVNDYGSFCPNCNKVVSYYDIVDGWLCCPHCNHKFKKYGKKKNENIKHINESSSNYAHNSIENSMSCPTCGKQISSDFERLKKRCPYCGHKFKNHYKTKRKRKKRKNRNKIKEKTDKKKEHLTYSNKEYIKCPKCKFKNDSTDNFCIKCGTNLGDPHYHDSININIE